MAEASLNGSVEVLESGSLDLVVVRSEIASLSTEELTRELSRSLRLCESYLLRLGVIVVELESRGEKPLVDRSLLVLLRKIGKGLVLPAIVVKFAARPTSLSKYAHASLEEQKEALKKDGYTLAEEGRRIPKSSGRVGSLTVNGQKQGPMTLASLARMTAKATVKDAAELCMEMVMANENPAAVARELLPRLQKLVKKSGNDGK